jgi:hypothetical protein
VLTTIISNLSQYCLKCCYSDNWNLVTKARRNKTFFLLLLFAYNFATCISCTKCISTSVNPPLFIEVSVPRQERELKRDMGIYDLSSPRFLAFCVMLCRSLFLRVFFLLAIVLSVLL